MRALSIRHPWAWLIVNGHKNREYRDWQFIPSYRGPLAIHAALKIDPAPLHINGVKVPMLLDVGCIIGICELWRAKFIDTGECVLDLRDPQRVKPIPLRGKLGLFKLPDEIAAKLNRKSNGINCSGLAAKEGR